MKNKDILLNEILFQIPRILSHLNRDPTSKTYGCADRLYWQWKFIDFPCARYQEVCLPLAFIYTYDDKNNIYYKSEKIKECYKAAFQFWIDIRHKNGSYDEAYPGENSFVATGFTLFYISESFMLMDNYLSDDEKSIFLQGMKTAGNWLLNKTETHAFISNHRLGTAAGLYNLYELTNNAKFRQKSEELITTVLKNQSREGWYKEYEGADPGYLTQGIYYMTIVSYRSKRSSYRNSLNKAVDFLSYFIHPDGTLGGEYGSRNTQFVFPGGIAISAGWNTIAPVILKQFFHGLSIGNQSGLKSLDVNNLIPVLSSYCHSLLLGDLQSVNEAGASFKLLPCFRQENKFFKDAGLGVYGTQKYYCIYSIFKGGVIKIYDILNKKLKYQDCGFYYKRKGTIFVTQIYNRKNKYEIKQNEVSLEACFFKKFESFLSPLKLILLRFLSYATSKSIRLSHLLKKLIVSILIRTKKRAPGKLLREIEFYDDKIMIKSQLVEMPEGIIVYSGGQYTAIHMGSSQYFEKEDLYKFSDKVKTNVILYKEIIFN